MEKYIYFLIGIYKNFNMSKFFAEGNISDDSDDSDDRQDQPANKAQKNKFGDIVNSVFIQGRQLP